MKHINVIYDENDELVQSLQRKNQHQDDDDDDEYSSLSFAALNSAQKQLSKSKDVKSTESPKRNTHPKRHKPSHEEKKKSKHAPTESSSKKPVSKIRKIPGLEKSTLYQDIRFDVAFGKADLQEARKNYAFLDEYRQNEINELNQIIKDKKKFEKLSFREQEEIKLQLQSLKSRMDTLKTRDLQHKVLDDYKQEQLRNVREGKQSTPYYLKKSEQRKLLQTVKFESMKPAQREKVMERKRKRKLGKEFKQLEFRNN